jgi:hypothetical protein
LRIKEAFDKQAQNEFVQLLQESVSPNMINDKVISFTAWKFVVTGTIYSGAKANDIVDGWKILANENILLIIYTKPFYITLFSWLYHDPDKNVEVNRHTVINNILEPESSELLRLCYWIDKCKRIIVDENSFQAKFNDVKSNLRFQNEEESKEQINRKLTVFGRIIQDETISAWERELNAANLVRELQPFRSNVSRFVPEFMLAVLAQEAGFHVQFISADTGSKTSDLVINSYKTEVKTFLDSYNENVKMEPTLKEIACPLKRNKAVCDINDSLLKRSEITFQFL